MTNSERHERPRSRVKARRKFSFLLGILTVFVGIIVILNFVSFNFPWILDNFIKNDRTLLAKVVSSVILPPFKKSEQGKNASVSQSQFKKEPENNSDKQTNQTTEINNSGQNTADLASKGNETPNRTAASAEGAKSSEIAKAVEEINGFFSHLEKEEFFQKLQLKDSGKDRIQSVLQKVLNNSPSLAKETDDYFTLMKNTAHFSRILGKENILLIKGILENDKGHLETLIRDFYLLSDHPQTLQEKFAITLPKDGLYNYASFLLNTIGGKLYLFRRDVSTRLLVSYYAVLIIDHESRLGNNPMGIDLRPAVNLLIEELESSGSTLKFKEEYLDSLYDLKEHYGNRG